MLLLHLTNCHKGSSGQGPKPPSVLRGDRGKGEEPWGTQHPTPSGPVDQPPEGYPAGPEPGYSPRTGTVPAQVQSPHRYSPRKTFFRIPLYLRRLYLCVDCTCAGTVPVRPRSCENLKTTCDVSNPGTVVSRYSLLKTKMKKDRCFQITKAPAWTVPGHETFHDQVQSTRVQWYPEKRFA